MRDTLRSPRQIVLRTELRKLRERQGLSQVTVAKRLNRHQSFVSKYESGERRLSVIEFIGHDLGAENWATIASLVETCKLNAVDPLAWMTDTLTKLVNLWPASRIDQLMPWAYAANPA